MVMFQTEWLDGSHTRAKEVMIAPQRQNRGSSQRLINYVGASLWHSPDLGAFMLLMDCKKLGCECPDVEMSLMG